MTNLNTSDQIFATVNYCGKTLLNTQFTGVSSISEIFNLIKNALNGFSGFVTLRLRNGSQGWSREQGLRIGPKPSTVSVRTLSTASMPVREAVQLSLF